MAEDGSSVTDTQDEVIRARCEGLNRKVAVRFDAGLELEVLEHYGELQPAEGLPF